MVIHQERQLGGSPRVTQPEGRKEMYQWKTPEYQAYVEAHNAMVEREVNGEVISAEEQLTVQVAFTNASVAATVIA
jgi:hypothetical protein